MTDRIYTIDNKTHAPHFFDLVVEEGGRRKRWDLIPWDAELIFSVFDGETFVAVKEPQLRQRTDRSGIEVRQRRNPRESTLAESPFESPSVVSQ